MINWSDGGGAFISAQELGHLLIHLKKIGLLGKHSAFFEGYGAYEEDVSLSFSEGTMSDTSDDGGVTDWLKDILYEMDDISPSGFLYPLTRAQKSNANNGYKNGVQDKKAGEYFIDMFKDAIQEEVYEFGWKYSKGSFVFRIPLNGITIQSASGSVDSSQDGDEYVQAGILDWLIEIDNNSIYKEVEE